MFYYLPFVHNFFSGCGGDVAGAPYALGRSPATVDNNKCCICCINKII